MRLKEYLLMTIRAGDSKLPIGWYFNILDSLREAGLYRIELPHIEFRVNEGDVDVVAIIEK